MFTVHALELIFTVTRHTYVGDMTHVWATWLTWLMYKRHDSCISDMTHRTLRLLRYTRDAAVGICHMIYIYKIIYVQKYFICICTDVEHIRSRWTFGGSTVTGIKIDILSSTFSAGRFHIIIKINIDLCLRPSETSWIYWKMQKILNDQDENV